ncbi:hypothetical protein H0H93_012235, partial [Arthromyces matolae]
LVLDISSPEQEFNYEREHLHPSRSYLHPKSNSRHAQSSRSDVKLGLRLYGTRATSGSNSSTSLSSYEPTILLPSCSSTSITNEGPEARGVPILKDRIRTQMSFALLDPIGPPPHQTFMEHYYNAVIRHRQPHDEMPNVENDERIKPPLYSLLSSALGYNMPSRDLNRTTAVLPSIGPLYSNSLWRYESPRLSDREGLSYYPHVPPVPTRNPHGNPNTATNACPYSSIPLFFSPNAHSLLPQPRPSSFPIFDPFRDEDESQRVRRGIPMGNPAVGVILADEDDDDYKYKCGDEEKEEKEWNIISYPTFSSTPASPPIPEEETDDADWNRRHCGAAEMAMKWVGGKTSDQHG